MHSKFTFDYMLDWYWSLQHFKYVRLAAEDITAAWRVVVCDTLVAAQNPGVPFWDLVRLSKL